MKGIHAQSWQEAPAEGDWGDDAGDNQEALDAQDGEGGEEGAGEEEGAGGGCFGVQRMARQPLVLIGAHFAFCRAGRVGYPLSLWF